MMMVMESRRGDKHFSADVIEVFDAVYCSHLTVQISHDGRIAATPRSLAVRNEILHLRHASLIPCLYLRSLGPWITAEPG